MKRKLNCILLIDDDEPTNFLNRLTIAELDCVEHIHTIQSAHEALDYLKCAYQPPPLNANCPQPELIFLDINMPAMDGWEFLEKYEALTGNDKRSIIVIMLTTSSNPEDESKSRQIVSVSEYRNKPLKEEHLREIMDTYFPGLC